MSIKDMMKGHKTAEKNSRDFVTENAISAILASPRSKPKAEERDWLASKNFAKRPAYLDRIAAQLASEREYVLELADAQQRDAAKSSSGGAVREMEADERAELIAQLKNKWTEVSKVRARARALRTSGPCRGWALAHAHNSTAHPPPSSARNPAPPPPLFAPQRYSLFAHRKISTTNSSVGEIRLKENCESLMDKLEKDILRLSVPAPIYISDS